MAVSPKVAVQTRADLAEFRRWLRSGRRKGYHYAALLGFRTYELNDLHERVQQGFSYSTLFRFQRNTHLSASALSELCQIPTRTLSRRRAQGKLNPEESDRVLRASWIFGRALELFEGDDEAAHQWLSSAQRALGGRVPLELAKTDVGAKEVEKLIGRLEHGLPT